MSRRHRSPIDDLRLAIDCLPSRTRIAMLDGISANEIIVGAYTDRDGGVCPMLAAHRHGGRTNFISFARAWDRFAGEQAGATRDDPRGPHPAQPSRGEPAGRRERRPDGRDPRPSRPAGTRPAERIEQERTRQRVRPGDAYRGNELGGRAGWSWLRPFRRLDDYEAALAAVEAEREALADRRSRELEPV